MDVYKTAINCAKIIEGRSLAIASVSVTVRADQVSGLRGPGDTLDGEWLTMVRDHYQPAYSWWRRLGASVYLRFLLRRLDDSTLRNRCRQALSDSQAVGFDQMAWLLALAVLSVVLIAMLSIQSLVPGLCRVLETAFFRLFG